MPSKLPDYQVIRGGLVLDVAKRRTAPADILIKGDAIREVGPPGLAAPDGAVAMDAADKLLVFPLSAVFFASGAIILTLAGVASYIPQSLGRDRRKH